jgi:putative MATE family efflux protein
MSTVSTQSDPADLASADDSQHSSEEDSLDAAKSDVGSSATGQLEGKLAGRSLLGQVLILAVWPFFELLLNSLVGVVDTAIAGRIDAVALDAIGFGAYVHWLLGMLHMAVGVGAAALVARAIGGKDRPLADAALGQAISLAAVWGVITAITIAVAAPWIAALFDLPAETAALVVGYLRWVAVGSAAGSVMLVGNACLRAAGDTRTPFLTMCVVNLVNIGTSLLFVFGPEPIGGHGVRGIAMGTAVAWILGAAIVLGVLLLSRLEIQLHLAKLRPQWDLLRRIVRVGIPSLIESSGMWVGNFAIFYIVGLLAQAQEIQGVMGAHIVAIRIESLSFLPGVALGTAAATLIGQYLGLGDVERAKKAVYYCWAIGAGLMTLMGIAFILIPEVFAAALASGDNVEKVREMATPLVLICGPIQLFFATYLVLSLALRGAGDTRGPMLITYASTFLIRLPAAYVLGITLGYGLTGIWFALCGELVLRGLFYIARFRHGKWKTIEV